MIQRIQSFYLILTAIVSVFFLSGNISEFSNVSGNTLIISLGGLSRIGGEAGPEKIGNLIALTGLLILIPVLSVTAIFLFKNRKLQMRFVLVLISIEMLLIAVLCLVYFNVTRNFNADIIPNIKLTIPVFMLLFSSLAYRRIKKDEDLVKSYDRMR